MLFFGIINNNLTNLGGNMGKRHNILSISTFKNSKYIDCLERNLEIKNFKKEYPTQFNFMFDTFKTLIYVNNVLFSDNDFNKVEMVERIRQYIENYLYVDYENSYHFCFKKRL